MAKKLQIGLKHFRRSLLNHVTLLSMRAVHYDYEAMGLQTLRTPSPKQQSRSMTPKRAMKQKQQKKGKQRAAYHKLFLFADKVDYALMVVGGTAAVLHGAAVPVFFIYFSRLINDLGHSMFDPKKQTAEVARVSLSHLFLCGWFSIFYS